jgi:NAD(P)-dependent dehydrogenase (short-subunit alcohol dehydrogenase family)
MELEGKTVLITGAGAFGGIGADTAALLASEGARVIISGRNQERGEKVAESIVKAGGNASFALADLSNLDDVSRLADEVGDVDVLVNNAAAYTLAGTLELTPDDFDEMFATNVKAPFFLIQHLAPAMRSRGSGSIINISTFAVKLALAGMSLYASTKGAMETLTRYWAVEFAGTGVRANAVAPGTISSENVSAVMGDGFETLRRAQPAKRIGKPREISEAVLFLASDRSSYVNGTVIPVDGAYGVVVAEAWPEDG